MRRPITRALALVALGSSPAAARDGHVTSTTTTTVYIDAGSADGLMAGATWQATVDGRVASAKVIALASHDAVLELEGPRPAIGATLSLPPGLTPPAPPAPRPPPVVMPPWHDDPAAIVTVQRAASREQLEAAPVYDTVISGELAFSTFVAADASHSSTSWEDVALASQLAVEHGSWRYDHLLEGHLAGSPELIVAPLQHAQARFDVYLMRLAYAPTGAKYAAAIGRLPASSLVELGTVDGGQAQLALDPQVDVTAFAGLRPASDLGLSSAPRAGASVAWHTATFDGLSARVDGGAAVDEYKGGIDRAATAASATVSTRTLLAHADAVVDLATDAAGRSGARLSRASGLVRGRRGRLTVAAQAGYDRPFLDRALADEAPALVLGPRTFAAVDTTYAMHPGFDLGSSVQASTGDGVTSSYVDVVGRWWSPTRTWDVSAAPHAIIGSLTDEFGVRGTLDVPLGGWRFGVGGSLDRVLAGTNAWAGIGRLSGSRPVRRRWRTSLSLQVAAGDGPVRVLAFGLLGYRLGS